MRLPERHPANGIVHPLHAGIVGHQGVEGLFLVGMAESLQGGSDKRYRPALVSFRELRQAQSAGVLMVVPGWRFQGEMGLVEMETEEKGLIGMKRDMGLQPFGGFGHADLGLCER